MQFRCKLRHKILGNAIFGFALKADTNCVGDIERKRVKGGGRYRVRERVVSVLNEVMEVQKISNFNDQDLKKKISD